MFYHYIKSVIISVKKNRFFYTLNLIGFSIGFLLLTIIFTYFYQEISFDRFHKNAENIYRIQAGGYGVTPPCFAEKLKNQIPEINGIVRFRSDDLVIVDNKKEINIGKIYYTDPEVFQVFSFKLLTGDKATALKAPFSIVISTSMENQLFGNSSSIGESIQDKDGKVYTITGIMEDIPYNSHIQANAFISIETLRNTSNDQPFDCSTWSILTYVSLSEGSKSEEAEKKINTFLEEFRMETRDGKIPLKLGSLKNIYFDVDNNKYDGSKHGNLQTLSLYFAISIFILFIVIINYINLSTAISASRIKEIAIRKINGASQSQIIKQTLLEASGTALISFIMALLFIELLLPQLSSLLNIQIAGSSNRLYLYLIYFIGIAVIGIIVGLIPGIFLAKTKEINALKNEIVFNSRGFQRKALLVIQLLIVAILMNSTFIIKSQINYIFKKDLGFTYNNIISFQLNEDLLDKNELLKHNLLKNPEIKYVSFSDGLIGSGFGKSSIGNDENKVLSYFFSIDPDYFDIYDININQGRNFSWDIATDSVRACIINEEACRVLEIELPINKILNDKKIVGVVSDFNFTSLHNQIEPLIIYCGGRGNVVQIKLSDDYQDETIQFISNSCKDISPDFNFDYTFLEISLKNLYKSEIELKSSFEFYSLITFIIALMGLFGLTLFMIKKKTREIIIRKLYGARFYDTLKLLSKEQIWITIVANILAIPISSLLMGKWLNNFQYRVDIGLLGFLITFIITIAFTLLAVLFVVLKTNRISIIRSLRHE